MKKLFLLLAIVGLFFVSCKKDEIITPKDGVSSLKSDYSTLLVDKWWFDDDMKSYNEIPLLSVYFDSDGTVTCYDERLNITTYGLWEIKDDIIYWEHDVYGVEEFRILEISKDKLKLNFLLIDVDYYYTTTQSKY